MLNYVCPISKSKGNNSKIMKKNERDYVVNKSYQKGQLFFKKGLYM